MVTYRFHEIKPKAKTISRDLLKYFKELNLQPLNIRPHMICQFNGKDDSPACILYYGENRSQIKIDKDKLSSVVYKGKPVFNVSGNGWGTGLSIMLNLSSEYDY